MEPVFIVGAGPSGLAAACFLTKLGIKFRIIDKNTERSDKSKALGVQAGTLECLDYALGDEISKALIAAGKPAREAWVHIFDQEPQKIDLSTIPSKYNYVLITAQSETERVLEEYLNKNSIKVERQTELVSLEEKSDFIISKIRNSKGELEEVQSSFVMGCDGAHSAVRHISGIPFLGDSYPGDFILGDVKMEWPWPYQSIRTFIGEKGLAVGFPMKDENRYRFIMVPNFTPPTPPKNEIDLKEFQEITTTLSHGKIKILESNWLTRFRVNHRMVSHFQKGRLFLSGDAAHIHSPAGGQGMNTGIQDVFNLTFKLNQVLSGEKPLSFLENYEKERLPVARSVLKNTDFATRFGILQANVFTEFAKRHILPLVIKVPWIQHQGATGISEVRIARKEISRSL